MRYAVVASSLTDGIL